MRREFTRDGRSVIVSFSQGSGTVTRDGVQETVPVWTAQSSHVPEFPFPTIADRLLDATTVVHFDAAEQSGLVHIKLTKPCFDPQGNRVPLAEKVYESDLYFDSSSGLLVKERYWIFSPSSLTNNAQVDVAYDNYQVVDGIQVPFHMTKRLGGVILSDTIIQSINLNADNSIALF